MAKRSNLFKKSKKVSFKTSKRFTKKVQKNDLANSSYPTRSPPQKLKEITELKVEKKPGNDHTLELVEFEIVSEFPVENQKKTKANIFRTKRQSLEN